jgi:hypothetical protein
VPCQMIVTCVCTNLLRCSGDGRGGFHNLTLQVDDGLFGQRAQKLDHLLRRSLALETHRLSDVGDIQPSIYTHWVSATPATGSSRGQQQQQLFSSVTWMVENDCRSTRKVLLPVSRLVWMRARMSTVLPS